MEDKNKKVPFAIRSTTRKKIVSTPIEKISCLSSYDIESLKENGINTLNDILERDKKDIEKIIPAATFRWDFLPYIERNRVLMREDREEYSRLGIKEYAATYPITELGFDERFTRALWNWGYKTLGRLLITDYNFLKFRFSEERLLEIKEKVHALGFKLKNEKKAISEVEKEYGALGIPTIKQELGIDNKLVYILYNSDVYTLDDIIKLGPEVYSLYGMGEVRIKQLETALKVKGIVIPSDANELPGYINEKEYEIAKLSKYNEEVNERIDRTKKLISKYTLLLEEKKELLKKDKQISKDIEEKIKDLQGLKKGASKNGKRNKSN